MPPSQQYRSYYGDQEFSRAEEEQYFGQPALDPKDDVAFENQFQSRRNYNYGDDFLDNGGGLGGTGSYYYDSSAFQYNNKVHITDVFSQASRDSVENVKRVHRKVTQVVAELPATAARIAQTDIVPAFALGLVLSAILSSFGNLIQSIRRDRFRRYQKMQRSGQRTLTEREEALVEIEREFSEMALAEWKSATREEMMEIPKQFWILCNAYAAIVFRIWEVRVNEAILSCGNALKAKLDCEEKINITTTKRKTRVYITAAASMEKGKTKTTTRIFITTETKTMHRPNDGRQPRRRDYGIPRPGLRHERAASR